MAEIPLQTPNADTSSPRSPGARIIVSIESNGGVYKGSGNKTISIAIVPVTVRSNRRSDSWLLALWAFNILFVTSISTELLYSLENL